MKSWYFKFEGAFTELSESYGNGVFTGCMIPEKNFQKAKKLFFQALKDNNISLIELIEYFSVNGDELDPADQINLYWIELCEKAKTSNEATFEIWHLYKLGT